MQATDKTAEQAAKCERDITEQLVKNATECTFYVALSKSLRRELAEKYGLTEEHVGGLLSKMACQLVDQIRSL